MKIKPLCVVALASLSAALSAQAATPTASLTPDKGCPNHRLKGVYAPCVGILPVGATSASQAVGVHHLSNPANQHVIKGMTVQQLVANHLLPTRLPSGAATFGLAYAMDMKGGAGQQNPTSPSPSPASVGCSYGFASGPTWSGWDAVGWQYTCAAPPPPPPPVYMPPSCVCQTSPFTGVVSCANQGGYACTPGAPAAPTSAYAPPPPAPAPTGGGSSGTTSTGNPPPCF